MKKATIILALLAAVITSCSSTHTAEDISWQAFCQARGHEITDNTDATLDEYLDTWRGTVEEDNALAQYGVEPF